MKTYKHQYTGKSLEELKTEYGTGSKGFCKQDWYENERFFIEQAPKGTYEIEIREDLINLTFEEQKKKLTKGFETIHPAILVEFFLTHFKETGNRLCENTWMRTSSFFFSDDSPFNVGYCNAEGVHVSSFWDDRRNGGVGVSASRKFAGASKLGSLEPVEDLTLDSAVKIVKKAGYKIFKE